MPEDYDGWAAAGNDEWTYTNLLPIFRRIETDTDYGNDDFHGGDGPIVMHRFARETWLPAQNAFSAACVAAGFPETWDHNHPDSYGVGPTPFNNPNGIRMSTNLGYLSESRHRLNLTIKANCHVHRILFDGNRAVGVQLESGGETFVAEADEIVLSSGAIGSPHILMLSGVGPAAHLREIGIPVVHDSPGVGQNLRDHPTVWCTWRTKPDFELDGLAPRSQLCLRYTADGSPLRNDMKISMQSFATERINRGGDRMVPLGVRMTAGIQLAEGAGQMRLQSTDPYQQPFPGLQLPARGIRPGAPCGIRCACACNWPSIRSSRLSLKSAPSRLPMRWTPTMRWMIAREVTTSQHISGTCKMGPDSDPMAVVDTVRQGERHPNLRVADASVMPDCIRATTNVSSMTIGEKVAEFIKEGR